MTISGSGTPRKITFAGGINIFFSFKMTLPGNTWKARFHKGLAKLNDLPEFESVVKLYEPLIKKFLAQYHLIYDYEEYQQIAWIALWEAYSHYDPGKGPFPAFASATVRGHLLTEIKKRKKYSDRNALTDSIPELSSSTDVYSSKVNVNLSRLSVREREWLEASVFHDLSTKEIAERCHVTQDTVRSWKKSAVKKLKQEWFRNELVR